MIELASECTVVIGGGGEFSPRTDGAQASSRGRYHRRHQAQAPTPISHVRSPTYTPTTAHTRSCSTPSFDDEDDDVEDDSLLIDQMTENEDDEEDPRNLDDTSTGEFREGAVVRVKLKNWVTYTDVEFFPGTPRLRIRYPPNHELPLEPARVSDDGTRASLERDSGAKRLGQELDRVCARAGPRRPAQGSRSHDAWHARRVPSTA